MATFYEGMYFLELQKMWPGHLEGATKKRTLFAASLIFVYYFTKVFSKTRLKLGEEWVPDTATWPRPDQSGKRYTGDKKEKPFKETSKKSKKQEAEQEKRQSSSKVQKD